MSAYADAVLVHQIRNGRALLRRKRPSDRLRAELEVLIPQLKAEALERGLVVRGWRAYPGPDGWLGSVRVTADFELIEELPRRRRHSSKPAATNPAELMDALMASIARSIRAGLDTHQSR